MAGFGAAALLVAVSTGPTSADVETTDGFICPILGARLDCMATRRTTCSEGAVGEAVRVSAARL